MVMIILKAGRTFAHGLTRKIGELLQPVFLMQSIYKIRKTVLCKECTFVQKYINENDVIFGSHQIMNLPFHHHIFMKNL